MASARRPMTPVRELSAREVATAKSEGKAAQALFASTLTELQQLVASVDGVELMARLAFTLQYSLGRKAQLDDRRSVEVFHLELLQAFFLALPRQTAAANVDYSAVSQKALDLITQNGLAFLDRSSGRASEDPAEDAQLALVDQVQRWTLAVRGQRHIHQTLAFLNELSPAIEVGFRRQFGCSLAELVKFVEGIFDLLSRRLTEDRAWRRGWMRDRKSQAGMVDAFCAPLTPEFQTNDLNGAENAM